MYALLAPPNAVLADGWRPIGMNPHRPTLLAEFALKPTYSESFQLRQVQVRGKWVMAKASWIRYSVDYGDLIDGKELWDMGITATLQVKTDTAFGIKNKTIHVTSQSHLNLQVYALVPAEDLYPLPHWLEVGDLPV